MRRLRRRRRRRRRRTRRFRRRRLHAPRLALRRRREVLLQPDAASRALNRASQRVARLVRRRLDGRRQQRGMDGHNMGGHRLWHVRQRNSRQNAVRSVFSLTLAAAVRRTECGAAHRAGQRAIQRLLQGQVLGRRRRGRRAAAAAGAVRSEQRAVGGGADGRVDLRAEAVGIAVQNTQPKR